MLTALLLLSAAAQPPNRPHISDDRIPSENAVGALEKRIVMPAGAGPLSAYDRLYTEANVDGKDMILGEMLPREEDLELARNAHKPTPAQVRRVRVDDMIPAFDGGCSIVFLMYEVGSKHPPRLHCNPDPGAR